MAAGRLNDELDEVIGTDELLKPRRQREDTEMDITPMIDITFLLLIFFLVASKMDQATPVVLPPAEYGTTVATRASVFVTIDKPQGDQRAPVYKGDGADPNNVIDSADLEDLENELQAYVEDTMTEDDRKKFVVIKAAKGVKHRDVARVAKAVARVAEVQRLHVAVMEAQ
jgi:biopolymer transport protein ExbD